MSNMEWIASIYLARVRERRELRTEINNFGEVAGSIPITAQRCVIPEITGVRLRTVTSVDINSTEVHRLENSG